MSKYTKRQSDNKHLWYAIDEEGKICYVSMFYEFAVTAWIMARSTK